jgi:hypothetical protein
MTNSFTPESVFEHRASNLDRARAREEQWRRATTSEARTRSTSQARDEPLALDRRVRHDTRRLRCRARYRAHASRQAVPSRDPAKSSASSRDREADARCRTGGGMGRGSRLPRLTLPCPAPLPEKQNQVVVVGPVGCGQPAGLSKRLGASVPRKLELRRLVPRRGNPQASYYVGPRSSVSSAHTTASGDASLSAPCSVLVEVLRPRAPIKLIMEQFRSLPHGDRQDSPGMISCTPEVRAWSDGSRRSGYRSRSS